MARSRTSWNGVWVDQAATGSISLGPDSFLGSEGASLSSSSFGGGAGVRAVPDVSRSRPRGPAPHARPRDCRLGDSRGSPHFRFFATGRGTHLFAIEVTGTPEGLLGAAGVPMRGATNTELVLDAIEHVYFLNRSAAGVEFYPETIAAFPNEWRGARRREGSMSLEAAQEDSRARDRLEDFLKAGGFLLLRNSGRLFVRPDPDSDAKARREALAAAGFPTADLDVRMNEGEAST